MSKIKNRFNNKLILTCHDNVLTELYNLSPNNITYKVINDKHYLVNKVIGKGYSIELRKQITESEAIRERLEEDIFLMNMYNKETYDYISMCNFLTIYLKYLTFSNNEKFLMNILLDKYLNSSYSSEKLGVNISFKEIEGIYRKRAISYRNISINDYTFNRYVETINSLCAKEMYFKSGEKFRQAKYGVNNRQINQRLLILNSYYRDAKNSFNINYTFGGFGNIIKLSRRYSNNVPSRFYALSFKQVKLHMVAFYIAKEIFIKKYSLSKKKSDNMYLEFNIDIYSLTDLILEPTIKENSKNRLSEIRRVARYVDIVLAKCVQEGIIYLYDYKYNYDETEKFIKKYQDYYDSHYNLQYNFKFNELSEDVQINFVVLLEA
jgi:hypothetical protein